MLLERFAPIFYFKCKHVLFEYIVPQKQTKKFRGFAKMIFMDFQNFQKSNYVRGKFVKLPWGHVRSLKIFGPYRFCSFDVYWSQTDKQTDKQSINIDTLYNRLNHSILYILLKTQNTKIYILDLLA